MQQLCSDALEIGTPLGEEDLSTNPQQLLSHLIEAFIFALDFNGLEAYIGLL